MFAFVSVLTFLFSPPLSDSVDPKLAEFLNLMQPRSKAKIWSSDDVLPSGAAKGTEVKGQPAAARDARDVPEPHVASDSDHEDEYQELGVGDEGGRRDAAAGTAGRLGDTLREGSEDEDEDEAGDDEDEASSQEGGDIGGGGEVADGGGAGMSDLDYLRSRVTAKWDDSDNDEDDDEGG